MKTPECGNCGGCPRAASCPFLASNREKVSVVSTLSLVAEKPSITSGISKIIDFQTRRNISIFPGVPLRESSGCTCGLRGTCSECKKAA